MYFYRTLSGLHKVSTLKGFLHIKVSLYLHKLSNGYVNVVLKDTLVNKKVYLYIL